jgi:rhodanese-related sulfurtransferase
MSVKRVSPEEAHELMRGKGYAYLDVRSVPEFDQGHPTGAYNVPLLHMGPRGTQPNARFLAVVESHFEKDAPIVVGCRTSGRSDQAVAILERAGFSQLLVQEAGFVGTPPLRPGWGPRGLPSSQTPEPGRSWDELAGSR